MGLGGICMKTATVPEVLNLPSKRQSRKTDAATVFVEMNTSSEIPKKPSYTQIQDIHHADQDLLQTIHRAAGEKATYLCISSRSFKF